MALVGSLTFFLLELRGQFYPEGIGWLRFVFFCYIVGVVLINRLYAGFGGQGSAAPYSLAMAGAMFLFVLVYTSMHGYIVGTADDMVGGMPLLTNLLIVAVVWIVADRVTKSCSFETDATADLGVGMVDSALRPWAVKADIEKKEASEQDQKDVSPFRRKHPGRAVFYFAFLAIPMFAIGQNMIPEASPEVVRSLFNHTIVYIASSLLLLMFTSYSGLRHYFNSRRTNMPGHVGAFWIVIGTLVAAAAIAVARVMPMPVPLLSAPEPVETAGTVARFTSQGPKWGPQESAVPDTAGKAREERLKAGEKAGENRRAVSSRDTQVQRAKSTGQQRDPFVLRALDNMIRLFKTFPRLGQALIAFSGVALGVIVVPLILTAIAGLLGATNRALKGLFGWAPRIFNRFMQALGLARLPELKLKLPRFALPTRKRSPQTVQTVTARFPNPFLNHTADSMPMPKLVDYSYQALLARGRDLGILLRDDQTEYEFLRQYSRSRPDMRQAARTLTEMHLLNEFSTAEPPEQWRTWLKEFWNQFT